MTPAEVDDLPLDLYELLPELASIKNKLDEQRRKAGE